MDKLKTLQQAIQYFANFDNCRPSWSPPLAKWRSVASLAGRQKIAYLENARIWRMLRRPSKQKFSLKVGTIFEDSPIPLEKWLPAVWLIVNCKNGVSAYEIHRALGVTQKSAWFMMHRIRLAMQTKSFLKMGGSGKAIEADESFIGGAARFMHQERRNMMITARGVKDKAAAFGILERGGEVRVSLFGIVKKKALQGHIAVTRRGRHLRSTPMRSCPTGIEQKLPA